MNVPAGPWEAIAANETEPYQVVGQYVVASDLPCEDAWLIAAAPDLYAALDALRLQALQSDVAATHNEWGREAIDRANAALAKARGEAVQG